MIELPCDITYTTPDKTEVIMTDWTKGQVGNLPYYETNWNGAHISIIPCEHGQWYLRVVNTGDEPIAGYWGIRFPWNHGENCYTLIPALYYNGNTGDAFHNIPRINPPVSTNFQTSFSVGVFPAVLVKNGENGRCFEISHKSVAGWNGVELDTQKAALTFYIPAREEKRHLQLPHAKKPRCHYVLEPHNILSVRFGFKDFPCHAVTDLLHYYWNNALRSPFVVSENTPKLTEANGAKMVMDWVYKRHCFVSDKGEPIILNAFTDLECSTPHIDSTAEWNVMIGWCSGAIMALPLLYQGGEQRDFAVSFLDFLTTHGDSPCGVKYPIYDGTSWMTKNHKQYQEKRYDHVRYYCDYLYYLGRAIRLEREKGHNHFAWEQSFFKGIEILIDLWGREHDFGLYWNLEEATVQLTRKGTGAGAFALLALAEACLQNPENAKLCSTFRQACRTYYERCVVTGRCNGGPADIIEADDSESIAALSDALLQNYKLFGGDENLQMAIQAAQMFSTWVVHYTPNMVNGSLFENINVCGGVVANIQNKHIGPGICTNSARFLYDLGMITKDERWCHLYWMIKAAAINCITTYDGEFYGISPNEPFYKGMLSEQINLGDGLSNAGETWRVSAAWPAASVLLGWMETPTEEH